MFLIVGLGNPGRRYKKTRHNIGFIVIDELKKHMSKKDAILLKPQTYMNNSGKAVKSLITDYGLRITNIIVIHDDIDLPLGTMRRSENISSAGHKGIQSIIDELGTQDFTRIRIGIRPPLLRQGFGGQAQKFVLENFSKQEEKQLKEIIKQAVEEIKKILIPGPVPER